MLKDWCNILVLYNVNELKFNIVNNKIVIQLTKLFNYFNL